MKNLLFLFCCLFLLRCTVSTSGTWKNDAIEAPLRAEIKGLNEIVMQAVANNDIAPLDAILSDQLREHSKGELAKVIEQVNKSVGKSPHRILDEFHVQNIDADVENTVSGTFTEAPYALTYRALNQEMYISLLVIETRFSDLLATCIYGKYPEGWKLNILQFGQIRTEGRSGPELFAQAKTVYEKGYLVDAANRMELGTPLLRPAGNFWLYGDEAELKSFQAQVMRDINGKYNFPLKVHEISSKPSILGIYSKLSPDGYFPMVEYVTELEMTDSLALKAENEHLHEVIGGIFPGLDKDKKYIFYKAFATFPDGKTPITTYGFVKENE